jgi:hypothetical protein
MSSEKVFHSVAVFNTLEGEVKVRYLAYPSGTACITNLKTNAKRVYKPGDWAAASSIDDKGFRIIPLTESFMSHEIHDIGISDFTLWSKDSDLKIKCLLRVSEYIELMKDFDDKTLYVKVDSDDDGAKYLLDIDELGFTYTDKSDNLCFGVLPNDNFFQNALAALEELNNQHPGGDVIIYGSLM